MRLLIILELVGHIRCTTGPETDFTAWRNRNAKVLDIG